MAVDNHVSDLFFNRNLDHCKLKAPSGQFIGFDEDELAVEAGLTIETLEGLLGKDDPRIPSLDDLLADFHARV